LGEEICVDGEYDDCDAPEPDSEVCNNLDDDCDGIIDDGNPGGGDSCLPNSDGTYELVDDPAEVDSENIICDLGTVTCMAGELICVGATGGTQEVCNCLDDDCDGEIDEDPNLCGEGAQCIDCRCVSPCFPGEFPCPVNRYCDTSHADEARNIIGLCVPGKCEGVECPESAICQPLTGECEDVCENTICAENESCIRGLCVEDNCYGRGCPIGERCRNAECQPDPCFNVECDANQFCREGSCIEACFEACAEQEICEDGECVAHPCGEPCYLGYSCVDGECVENSCGECGEGRVCQGDSCVDDPCEGIACPGETECRQGQCMVGGEPVPEPPSRGQEEQKETIRRVLATGGGGCDCVIAGPPSRTRLGSSGVLVFIAGLIFLFWRRTKRSAKRSWSLGACSIMFVLTMILISGCKVDPYALSSTGEDAGKGGSKDGKGDSGQTQQGEGGISESCTSESEEVCNEEDDDCDGLTDEDFDLQTDLGNCGACNRKCLLPQAFAKCEAGECAIEQCEAGYQDLNGLIADGCEYLCTRTGNEICDGRDNDCDGLIDEGLDLQNDIANCGACGNVCQFANASASCEDGVCVMGDCVTTYFDANDDPSDGCELKCVPSDEICNGADDDCDGDTDEDLTAPEGLCVNTSHTPCESVQPVCDTRDAGTTWYCDYPSEVEFNEQVSNGISAEETLCDGEDNDCDGATDEPFADLGTACDDGGIGICRGTGSIRCISTDETGCVITNPAQSPQDEVCNGRDDDCDGDIDEPEEVVDDMVHIDHHGLNFYIYRYEASRPDATEDSSGISYARACCNPDVMPWNFVSFEAASEACENAGHRLCTSDEWLAACESASEFLYPYGNTYNKTACNGADHGAQSGQTLTVLPTRSVLSCRHPTDPSDALVFDMSGNVKEWTNDSAGTAGDGTPIYVVRGGSFETPKFGLTCQTVLSQALSTTLLPGLGFRCCRDDAP
jgi:Notch-like protein